MYPIPNNLLKYSLVIQEPEVQVLILQCLILALQSDNINQRYKFAIKAAYIDVKGIVLVLSGVPLPLVIFWMVIEGTNLIMEARRVESNGNKCDRT
ncbi:hypothetical protein [Microseira sp. BLCC-F43]|jgi:hypothetical protein|uniref:hypothetical protein n=1 Tax=Microseira sp. BLCC-F43 TaxID=3153602 RepID=UPI0035B9097C